MKCFENIENLWEYCLYCPICKTLTREIDVIIGPEDTYNLYKHKKYGSYLSVNVNSRDSDSTVNKYQIIIDCKTSTFIVNKQFDYSPDINTFYLYFYSNCSECDSYINSADIDFNFNTNTLHNITLDQEGLNLLKGDEKYNILMEHLHNDMIIYRLTPSHEGRLKISDSYVTLPMINFDFSNQDLVLNKIKTLLLFS